METRVQIGSHDFTDLQVLAKESLKEAALPAAPCPQNVAAEDAALGLFLLQINALVTGYWNESKCTFSKQEHTQKQILTTYRDTHTFVFLQNHFHSTIHFLFVCQQCGNGQKALINS